MSKHPCFYPVKKTYLTPLQQMWDDIHAGEKITSFFPKFKRDITRAGELNLPLERQVRAWAKDVAAGVIPRPSTIGGTLSDECTDKNAPPSPVSGARNSAIQKAAEQAPAGKVEHLSSEPEITVDELTSAIEAGNSKHEADTAMSPIDTMADIMTSGTEPAADHDPVKDAIDIIVDHYQQKAFAKARKEAAIDAAKALRFFADKVEASA